MASFNAPVSGRVERVAADLAPALAGFETISDRHTLLVKRLDDVSVPDHVVDRARRALVGVDVIELRVAGVDVFEEPPLGPGPVCYLAVESPGLVDVHRRLVEEFGAMDGLEGDDYVPHVTLARGGRPETLDDLLELDVAPISWTVREIELRDPALGKRVGTVSLG